MNLFDENSCASTVYPLSERCSFLNRNVIIILTSVGSFCVFSTVFLHIICYFMMLLAKRSGSRVSSYSASESKLIIITCICNGMRNVLGLFYPIVPPSLVFSFYMAFFSISFLKIYQYLYRASNLFQSIKCPLPLYIRKAHEILQSRKKSLIYMHAPTTVLYAGLITPFIFSSHTQLLYLMMIHGLGSIILTALPIIYISFATYKHSIIWEKHILDLRSTLFKTSLKVADDILFNIDHLKKSLRILTIMALTLPTINFFMISCLPLISKSVIGC